MKKTILHIILLSMILALLVACGGKTESEVPQNTTETEEETAIVEENETEENAGSDPVSLTFDPNVYVNSNDDTYLIALSYATNRSDKVVMATVRCKAFDESGQIIAVYDWIRDKSSETWSTDIFVPENVEEYPIAFDLPQGFRYNIKEDSYLPEIDHMEFEITQTQEMELEDLRTHLSPSEAEVKGNHVYVYMTFDEQIADKYSQMYVNYTLLALADGEVTGVCCRNDFPYSGSFYSVTDAKEKYDGSFLAYHSVPGVPITEWKMYIGCVGGE